MKNEIICWWSGGVPSAVTGHLCIKLFGLENCRFIFIDTHNEDPDTYRFKKDCEKWYGKEIETISAIPDKYKSIQEVWLKFLSLNTATGAICSTELKRAVREEFEKNNKYIHQAFGFDIKECNRAYAMAKNYPKSKPIFPLLLFAMRKEDCFTELKYSFIPPPISYILGLRNNNCLGTGCVQGGIGYWQWIEINKPILFDKMADMEHYLTDLKGKPVTINKDQSKGGGLVFLKPHPDYPEIKDLSMMKGRKIESLIECNGFCGTNDLSNGK